MKINTRLLTVCVAIPLIAGGASALITNDGMETLAYMNKPQLAPPAWLFPVVWTILYTLMGISSYLVITSDAEKEQVEKAIKIYGCQLAVNFLWPTFFFNFGWYFFAFIWLVLLWILVLMMITKFKDINKAAAYMNVPYTVWLTFAGYLNFAIWLLNR